MYWLLFIFLGFGASAYVVIVNIADYPPPEIVGRLWVVFAAGGAGGAVGGALFGNMLTANDPMPARPILSFAALLGVIATGLAVSAGTALLAGFAKKAQAGR